MHSFKTRTAPPAKAELRAEGDDAPLIFSGWYAALNAESWPERVKTKRQLAIMRLLKFCKVERRPVSITLIRGYLSELETQGNLWPETREGLRWFVSTARQRASASESDRVNISGAKIASAQTSGVISANAAKFTPPPMLGREVPSASGSDLGGPQWEQALIRALRTSGKLWRTEQTYRGWSWRFVDFLKTQKAEDAGAAEVRAFLGDLAVRQRVGIATQKQALNAVVFLLREGLGGVRQNYSEPETSACFHGLIH